jgi:hypothetical protein
VGDKELFYLNFSLSKYNVKDFIINSNNNYLYTVRYHSENNPIENFFNQLKHYIKLKSP